MRTGARWALALAAVVVATVAAVVIWFTRHPLQVFEAAQRRALERAGFERVELGAGGERMVLFSAGRGPALLFLHGLGDQAGTWSKVAPAFLADHRVVAVDLPGHGESEPLGGDLTMATLMAGAERALVFAANDGPVTVVGNSLGAWLATLLAQRHPEQVGRLVLVNGGALAGEPGGPSLAPKNRSDAAELMRLLRDPGARPLPGYVLDDVVRRAANGPIARLSRDLPGMVAHLLDGRLGEVATPTELVWGESDRLIPLAYAERLRAALPAVRLTRVERCGHVPQIECPERFTALLVARLAAAPPAASAP